ncbi:unnamed protein product [Urochloa decumbens]|uniref:Protein TIFY n=1 Tax=Urochloa decumbens TaxID=240449 RepID=A0ABC8YF88_9POAL
MASTSRRFAAACRAPGQYVKAVVPLRPLPLMPGADVPDDQEQPAQLTIVYGGRALVVLDDVPADKVADLLRLAASAAPGGATTREPQPSADMPVARKASLQRFMEKRRGRAAARRAPYRRPDGSGACHEDHLKLAL